MNWDDERDELLESFIDEIYQEYSEKELIISNFIKEKLGGLPVEKILECLKEKYPENFI